MRALSICIHICFLVFSPFSIAQTKREIVNHMLENRVGLMRAGAELGYGAPQILEATGYTNIVTADKAMALVFPDCVTLTVRPIGSAEGLGIRSGAVSVFATDQLATYVRLPICQHGNTSLINPVLSLTFTVWTEGNDYPIAYYVELDAKINAVDLIGVEDNPYRNAYLGTTMSSMTSIIVEEAMIGLIRDFATIFLVANSGR
jgi:hypothetical protein